MLLLLLKQYCFFFYFLIYFFIRVYFMYSVVPISVSNHIKHTVRQEKSVRWPWSQPDFDP